MHYLKIIPTHRELAGIDHVHVSVQGHSNFLGNAASNEIMLATLDDGHFSDFPKATK